MRLFRVTEDVRIMLNGDKYLLEAGDMISLCEVKDRIPGGVADDRSPEDFDEDELMDGQDVEFEHTDDPEIAQEIAMDHIGETGMVGRDGKIRSDYYEKLRELERELDAEKKTVKKKD